MPEKINLYDLELHESMTIQTPKGDRMNIIRVPGGWIYIVFNKENSSTTFVPLSKEFRDTEDQFFVV